MLRKAIRMDYPELHHSLHGSGGAVAPTPTRSSSLTTAANIVVPFASDNPVLSTAMQVLDQISDVGKALPFVAPVFVLLKIIIDIEQQAADVDSKCDDLVDRITFMLGHLPVLSKIEVIPSTRKVIDRINGTMKDAVALIAAYRKQGRVARRLSISNREKFATCADSVNACCRDLLMSLQIHQSVQLDILTRAIPIDEDDAAAETFVAAHGGSVDAVVHDRELVKEFAQQQHLVMDDSVMEQLNANIADSVKQNHVRLEGILRDNVQSSIVDGLKNLAAEMLSAEAEQKFICVQCEKEFTNYTNGPKACSFHRADYDIYSKAFPCCGTSHPCEFGTHRTKHHCDYPYSTFFPRSLGILYGNEQWASVEDTNLETDEVQKAFVVKLLHWVSRGPPPAENTLAIVVGRVWHTERYYLHTFTAQELEEISQSVRLSRRTLIFRTSPDENEYAMAEWVLATSGNINGIRITAKSATSTDPYVQVCPIDLSTCTKSGDVVTLSEGGIRSYIPASPYVLPETVRIGPELSDDSSRPVRTNFKTRTTPALRVILKCMSDPPLAANPRSRDARSSKYDYFQGTVAVFNNNAPGSLNPVTIAGISAEYRMVGDPEYAPVQACTVINGSETSLPVTIDPRQSWQLNFQVVVPRTEEDAKLGVQWSTMAFLARYRPVRIKLTVEDIEGEQCSLVIEYVFKPYPYEKREDDDLDFFFFDNPSTFQRNYIHVKGSDEADEVFRIKFTPVTAKTLKKVVYQALKSGKTEVDLQIGRKSDGGEWEWSTWALVDISCRRVYALKFILHEGSKVVKKRFGCLGYVLCPNYGECINETRPISYATETAELPPIEPYTFPDYMQDDALDDSNPPVPPKLAIPDVEVPQMSSGLNESILVGLGNRLASIDNNLARIVEVLEKIATALPSSK